MAVSTGSTARFRQRKISVKQNLQIFLQSDIPDLEDEQQRELQQVETGVEKGEEDEHHLRQAINASYAASNGARVEQVYIPTPDASKRWNEYEKYYEPVFTEPHSYIRMSATVEDVSGCQYSLDEVDEEFLQKFNKERASDAQLTEDDFEMICDRFETALAKKQPFIAMDPSQLLSFEELEPTIKDMITESENDPASPEFLLATTTSSLYLSTLKKNFKQRRNQQAIFRQFGQGVYPHWRARKIERHGKPIFPALKFEESAEKDDNDPYVCFRRREVRQVRKTRRADQQSSERLRRLQAEMDAVKKLMEMVATREKTRKEALQAEWDIFEERCLVKDLKRSLGIRGEDEDLVAHKKKKVVEQPTARKAAAPASSSALAAAAEKTPAAAAGIVAANTAASSGSPIHSVPANMRLPASKIPETEMTILEQVALTKEAAIRNAVKNKLKTRAQADRDWVNYTDNPFVPYCDYFDPDPEHRKNIAVTDAKYAATSSIAAPYPPSSGIELKLPLALSLGSSYSSRVEQSPQLFNLSFDKDNGDLKVDSVVPEKSMPATGGYKVPRRSAVALRRRTGRGGRVFIDRRGLVRRNDMSAFSEISGAAHADVDGDVEMADGAHKANDAANCLPSYSTEEFWGERQEIINDRFKFDSDVVADKMEYASSDPSSLNGISDETQAIRFGSMILSKAYESYREAFQLRQQQLLTLQQKLLAQQQQQQQQQQNQSSASPGPDQGQNQGQGPGQGQGQGQGSTPGQLQIQGRIQTPQQSQGGQGQGNGKGAIVNGASNLGLNGRVGMSAKGLPSTTKKFAAGTGGNGMGLNSLTPSSGNGAVNGSSPPSRSGMSTPGPGSGPARHAPTGTPPTKVGG